MTLATVSHKDGTAIIETNAVIDKELLKKAVEDKDYQVLSIK